MDDYNFFGGHTYLGSPLGGLHTYQLTLSSGSAYDTSWWHYLQKQHISKYLYRSYDRLCTSLLLRNKNSSKNNNNNNLSEPYVARIRRHTGLVSRNTGNEGLLWPQERVNAACDAAMIVLGV
jgi:hypothetical protein